MNAKPPATTLPIYRWLLDDSGQPDPDTVRRQLRAVRRDPRLARVVWADLVPQSRIETVVEVTLCLPWLAGALGFAAFARAEPGLWAGALVCSFMLFLTGLRQVHNATHLSLGLGRHATDWFLAVSSILMLGSNHSVKVNHLRHHRHCLAAEDVEGVNARLKWWQTIIAGPVYPVLGHIHAWRKGSPAARRWIAFELALNVLWIGLVIGVIQWPPLIYHIATMAIAQCCTAFFAVWITHHDSFDLPFPARSQRGWVKTRISYQMFYHLEHHLFPQVPTCHLHELAARLETVAPDLRRRQVY